MKWGQEHIQGTAVLMNTGGEDMHEAGLQWYAERRKLKSAPTAAHPGDPPPCSYLLLGAEGLGLQFFILTLGNPQELLEISLREGPNTSVRHSPEVGSKASDQARACRVPTGRQRQALT